MAFVSLALCLTTRDVERGKPSGTLLPAPDTTAGRDGRVRFRLIANSQDPTPPYQTVLVRGFDGRTARDTSLYCGGRLRHLKPLQQGAGTPNLPSGRMGLSLEAEGPSVASTDRVERE